MGEQGGTSDKKDPPFGIFARFNNRAETERTMETKIEIRLNIRIRASHRNQRS